MYTIYTDGAYSSSRDTGGLAAVITHEGNIIKKIYKGFKHTTNNRMEAMAVLEVLKYFDSPETLEIYSDSQYVVNTISQG
jgi:ribonuclease HI